MLAAVVLGPVAARAEQACTASDGIGVARTIDIDARGGPWLGLPYGNPGLLAPGEVVLTFDDGPMPGSTSAILAALAAECTKATFFLVGQMAAKYPEIVQEIAAHGHTIGTHTWSHPNLSGLTEASMKAQIELAFTAVEKAAGRPIAPFFRYPYLSSTAASRGYLRSRDIAQIAIDIDSHDYLTRNARIVVYRVMKTLAVEGRGIVLLHDIRPSTALAVPALLAQLKEKGFKVVHLKPATPVHTLVAYDISAVKGVPGQRRRRQALQTESERGGTSSSWTRSLWQWPPW